MKLEDREVLKLNKMKKTEKNFKDGIDEQLALSAQQGDEISEEKLLEKYREVAKIKAHQYFIEGADKEDVLQEGMIGIFKAIRTFKKEGGAKFATYANQCIERQIITAIRKATRQKHNSLNNSTSLDSYLEFEEKFNKEVLTTTAKNNGPLNKVLFKELLETVKKDKNKIFSDMEKRILNKLLEGKDYIEISKEEKKTPKAIDNAIQRAKKKIYLYLWEE